MVSIADAYEILSICGISTYKTREYRNQIWVRCPFPHGHKMDRKPSMSIKLTDNNLLYYCTACKQRGNALALAKEFAPGREERVQEILRSCIYGNITRSYDNRIPLSNAVALDTRWQSLYDGYVKLGPQELEYWTKRDISEKTIVDSKAKYSPKDKRIYFPVFSIAGNMAGLMGRSILKDPLIRWLPPIEGFEAKSNIFVIGEYKTADSLILVEGIGDVLKVYEAGYKTVIAVFGAHLSEEQAERILFMSGKIQIFFDGDTAGTNGAVKAHKKLKRYSICDVISCPSGRDPGELSVGELHSIFNNNGIKYEWEGAMSEIVADPKQTLFEKQIELFELESNVMKCERCAKLVKSRNTIVFGVGSISASLMLIGEAPGWHEDRRALPFVGESGKLLSRMLLAIGLSREEIYIANALKCRPDNNRNPEGNELDQCSAFLYKQIEILQPKMILTMGGYAARVLLKRIYDDRFSVSSVRGGTHEFYGIDVICTYHPSYLLRNPQAKKQAWEDLKILSVLLKSKEDKR